MSKQTLPENSDSRKRVPLASGVLDYFPAALAAVARISKFGNDKHNPGQPLHWARGKSSDHADCIARHLVDRGLIDPETGESHTAELAWRALALLQLEEEERGAPMARGARGPEVIPEQTMATLYDITPSKAPFTQASPEWNWTPPHFPGPRT